MLVTLRVGAFVQAYMIRGPGRAEGRVTGVKAWNR